MKKTLMAVGAHADDIEFNCWGTLMKHHEQGYAVVYVMATNNMSGCVSEIGRNGRPHVVARPGPVAMMALRQGEAAAGAECFGATPIHLDHPQRHYNGPDGKSVEVCYGCALPDGVPPGAPTILTAHECEASRRRLADLIMEHEPEWIFTHGVAQRDMEHVGTSLLVTKSYWDAVERGHDGGLLHWREGHTFLGKRNADWDVCVDTTGYLDRKFRALALHKSQAPDPFIPNFYPRQYAHECGKACGCETAELFTVVEKGKAGELR